MLTVVGVLCLVGFLLTIAHAIERCPLWIPVLLLYVIELLRLWPAGR